MAVEQVYTQNEFLKVFQCIENTRLIMKVITMDKSLNKLEFPTITLFSLIS